MALSRYFLPRATVPVLPSQPHHAHLGLIIMLFPKNTHWKHCCFSVWQLQWSTEEAAWMIAHHINSWKKRLCKYFISTAASFDLRATSVAVLSLLRPSNCAQIWLRLISDEINSHVKGLGFVLKYCWKASQWFHWLKRKESCCTAPVLPVGWFHSNSFRIKRVFM